MLPAPEALTCPPIYCVLALPRFVPALYAPLSPLRGLGWANPRTPDLAFFTPFFCSLRGSGEKQGLLIQDFCSVDIFKKGCFSKSMKPRFSQMKLRRNQNLIRYKRNHPGTSLASIGRIFHISRQRVFSIINHQKGGT